MGNDTPPTDGPTPPPLPNLPADWPTEVTPTTFSEFFKLFWRTIVGDAEAAAAILKMLPSFIADMAVVTLSVIIGLQGKVGKLIGQAIMAVEQDAEPTLLEAASKGLEDFFGTPVPAESLKSGGAGGFATELGRMVMGELFGAFPAGEMGISPDQGQANAERLFGYVLSLSLRGWIMGVGGLGFLEHYFPSWGNLKDIVERATGLGRMSRRALAPLLTASIVTPFTQRLNQTYRPKDLTVPEAVRGLNRGSLNDGDLAATAAREGYASELLDVLKVIHSTLPSAAEATKLYQLGMMDSAALVQHFKNLGFPADFVDQMAHSVEMERRITYRDKGESTVLEMVGAREMDDSEAEGFLRSFGRSQPEIEEFLGVAHILRSRPKLPSEADMQLAYEEGIISITDLDQFNQLLGYAPEHAGILAQLAERKKQKADATKTKAAAGAGAAAPKKASESLLIQAYVDGFLSSAQLSSELTAAGYTPEALSLILQTAAKRKVAADAAAEKKAAPPPAKPPKKLLEGTVVELFARGIIDQARLRAYLAADGYSQADGDALVMLALQQQAARAAQKKAGQAPTEKEISQANLIKAYVADYITEAELTAGLKDLRYQADDIAIILQIAKAEHLKAATAASSAAAAAAAAPGQVDTTGAPIPQAAPTKKRKKTATLPAAAAPVLPNPAG